MSNAKSPCYNCANRNVTPEHNCHSDCECRAKEGMARELLIKSVERSGHKKHNKRVKGRYR